MGKRKDETREDYNARMTLYQKGKYEQRVRDAREYLGDKCVDCGMTAGLEFDHRDPSQKLFNISAKMDSAPWQFIVMELDKCDLRCIACHAHQTAVQRLANVDALGLSYNGKDR